MASELARQYWTRVSRQRSRFAITPLLEFPPSKSSSRRWNNLAMNFAFPLGASIPTNGKRTADLLQSMVKSLIGHDMAQPPTKHWQSFGLPFTRYNRKADSSSFEPCRTIPNGVPQQTKSRVGSCCLRSSPIESRLIALAISTAQLSRCWIERWRRKPDRHCQPVCPALTKSAPNSPPARFWSRSRLDIRSGRWKCPSLLPGTAHHLTASPTSP